MAGQETANVAALTLRACSPDAAALPHYTNPYQVNIFEHNDEFEDTAKENVQILKDGASKLQENFHKILNGPSKLANGRPKTPTGMISDAQKNDNTDDLADIYISDEVLKQLMSQNEENGTKAIKHTTRKLVKTHSKAVRAQALNNKEEQGKNVKENTKKILKSSLRQKNNLSASKSQYPEHRDKLELHTRNEEDSGNKAENNNWMVDEEKSGFRNSAGVTKYYKNNMTSYVDTVTQSSDNVCKISSIKNAKEETDNINPVTTKEFSFKRGDSSDDSGCFSNLSARSISSLGAENHEGKDERHDMGKKTIDLAKSSLANPKSKSSGLCNACGHETQDSDRELCQACIGRIKQDGLQLGALGELKAYAQSFADSVKKILSISPRENDNDLQSIASNDGESGNKTGTLQPQDASVPSHAGSKLYKCKTQLSMVASEEVRSKSQLNKSLSFDGRAKAHLEERNTSSPMYFIHQDKSKIPISSTTITEVDEDKLQTVSENTSNPSLIDGDYFSSCGKDAKQQGTLDENKISKRDRVEKTKKRHYMKQHSYVERARIEGDSRENYLQQAVPNKNNEQLNRSEYHRSKSKISRTSNLKSGKLVKNSQMCVEDRNALNDFRLKVIHEGSPVDPLYTVQRVKDEAGKERRAALMRSATAPDKKHMPRKDSTIESKPDVRKTNERAKTMNTKLPVKINKTPPHNVEEDTFRDMKKQPLTLYEPPPESWRDESSALAVIPFITKRSSSYDNSTSTISKRGDLRHRSISRPAIDRDRIGNKERRRASSNDKSVVIRNTVNEGRYSIKNLQKLNVAAHPEDTKTVMPLSCLPSIKQEIFSDSNRYHVMEPYHAVEPYHALEPYKEVLLHNNLSDSNTRIPKDEELESSNNSPYFVSAEYYNQPDKQTDLIAISDVNTTTFDTESYYCSVEEPDKQQLLTERALTFGSVDVDSILKDSDQEGTYHNEIQKYEVPGRRSGKCSPWYSSQTGETALTGRDRSHESKSSTSFHILNTVKSSHSDVAVKKYQGSLEYASSRRQSMYSETDVDTGLIYHFAKRQTTRAHVPAYHDLTSSSKDIYTMSGDVSTPASSNSANSIKSEVSDCIYTGGFFKRDPFYENESKVSSSTSSAEDSSSHIYFEPCNSMKQEPSELDIYTGALFSSSLNAISLAKTTERNSSNTASEALRNGSTNNSTRPPGNRTLRRLRYRPHIDVIKFKTTDSASELLSKSIEINNDFIFCNISNNSCTGYDIDDFEDIVNQGAVVKQSVNSFYTDYDAEARPSFAVKKTEKPALVLDFRKYDKLEELRDNAVIKSSSEHSASDDLWYSGFRKRKRKEPIVKQTKPNEDLPGVLFSWQYHDDYYRSSQRQGLNTTNNCNCLETEQIACNTNNNRFEDLYTGFFEASNVRTNVPEEQNNIGKTSIPENWYENQSNRSNSPMFFSDNSKPIPEYVSGSSATNYGSAARAFSTTSVFGQASAAYSESSTYMNESGWREYDKNQTPSVNSFDESPNFTEVSPPSVSIGEKYSYFPYASSKSPPMGSYLYDTDTYAFDQRVAESDYPVNEIRKVGGIVCRDNVANKEDYAEDVNRDLEQGAWMPFMFAREEAPKHQEELNLTRSELVTEIYKPPPPTELVTEIYRHPPPTELVTDIYKPPPPISGSEKPTKQVDETTYSQNLIYDNMGARNKWREMANLRQQESVKPKTQESPVKGHPGGDSKRQDYMKVSAWNPPDNIPERALGKRPAPIAPKPTVIDGSKVTSKTATVIASVTSIPSRLTNYVKKWF